MTTIARKRSRNKSEPQPNGLGFAREQITSAPRGTSYDPAFDILRSLRGDILSGVFKPGERLKIEALRTRYHVSVGSLREALLHLLSEGLVRSKMNRGFKVAPASVADLLDITELRIMFEIKALADAIEYGDEAWEAEIVTSLHLLVKLGDSADPATRSAGWPARHRRFHQALVGACRSPWLLHFRNTLFDQAERYRCLGRTYRRSPRDVNLEHQRLAEATLARDVAKTCTFAEQHIRGTVENILHNVPGLAKS